MRIELVPVTRATVVGAALALALSGAATAPALALDAPAGAQQPQGKQAPATGQPTAPAAASTAQAAVAKVGDASYATLKDAVDAVNASSSKQTLTLLDAAAADTGTYTFTKPLKIAAENAKTAFHAGLVLEAGAAGSSIEGVHLVQDASTSGKLADSVLVKASDVTVSGSTFDIARDANKEAQLTAIRVQSGTSGTKISGNSFNIATHSAYWKDEGQGIADTWSWCAVNLIGGTALVKDVQVTGNKLVATPGDAVTDPKLSEALSNDTNRLYGSIQLVVGNGNLQEGRHGIEGLLVKGNETVNKTGKPDAESRLYGTSVSNSVNATVTENDFGGYIGVGFSVWGNQGTNSGLKIFKNSLTGAIGIYFNATVIDKTGVYVGADTPDENAFGTKTDRIVGDGLTAQTQGTIFMSLSDAVAAAPADGTVKLVRGSNESVTIGKKLTITSGDNYFGGTLRLTEGASGSTILDSHFTINKRATDAGVAQSVVVSGARDVAIKNSFFEIAHDAGQHKQLSSVWLENGAQNTKVTGNRFYLSAFDKSVPENNDRVAVNLVGSPTAPIQNTEVSKNSLLDRDQPDGVSTENQMLPALLMASGNNSASRETAGISKLTIAENKVGWQDKSFVRQSSLGFRGAVIGGGVRDVEITGNIFNTGRYGVQSYLYGGSYAGGALDTGKANGPVLGSFTVKNNVFLGAKGVQAAYGSLNGAAVDIRFNIFSSLTQPISYLDEENGKPGVNDPLENAAPFAIPATWVSVSDRVKPAVAVKAPAQSPIKAGAYNTRTDDFANLETTLAVTVDEKAGSVTASLGDSYANQWVYLAFYQEDGSLAQATGFFQLDDEGKATVKLEGVGGAHAAMVTAYQQGDVAIAATALKATPGDNGGNNGNDNGNNNADGQPGKDAGKDAGSGKKLPQTGDSQAIGIAAAGIAGAGIIGAGAALRRRRS